MPPAAANDAVCPELECLRDVLPRAVLAAAEERAVRVGVSADRVLMSAGTIAEETYVRALADDLGVAFEPFEGMARERCPLAGRRLLEAARTGLLPLRDGNDLLIVVAPRGLAARRLSMMIRGNAVAARRFRFTTAERLNRFILRSAGKTLAVAAAEQLKRRWPQMSAAPVRHRVALPMLAAAAAVLAVSVVAPNFFMHCVGILLAVTFLGWLALRLTGILVAPLAPREAPAPPDTDLPVYTIIVALYREARSVDGLLSAIERLDYPAEKLDIILALEADDRETRAAVAAHRGRVPVSSITAPSAGPRTKPKALNAALPFARGTFTVIYDAEDRPEPGQLREALRAFAAGGARLACVQAALCIDNTADGLLARLFTAEYAGQFDVFLPALAAMQLPLPLGGSSNHFRTEVLRKAGGWDAYNVTEDADLGTRLARFGYWSEMIASTTYEEAPTRLAPWLRQRTRWFKGWMQTWLVHMRQPGRLMRDLGVSGFLAFQLSVGANTLAALVHPLFLIALLYDALSGHAAFRADSAGLAALAALYGSSAVAGYLVSALLGWVGLSRRKLAAQAWVLLLIPAHWLLLSTAAWRALYQLIFAPYRWEKTEHGLARSSRRMEALTRALIKLERHLQEMEECGQLPPAVSPRHRRRAGP